MRPDPAVPLRLALRLLPAGLHQRGLALACNHLLRGQDITRRLDGLHGRRLWLTVTDAGIRLRLRFTARGLAPDDRGGEPDIHIRGALADFIALASGAEDPDTLFFARRLVLEGDTAHGLYLKNLLDAWEFDLEAHLAAVLGPRLGARAAALVTRSGLPDRLRDLARRLAQTPARPAPAQPQRQSIPAPPYQ